MRYEIGPRDHDLPFLADCVEALSDLVNMIISPYSYVFENVRLLLVLAHGPAPDLRAPLQIGGSPEYLLYKPSLSGPCLLLS